jgi:hypothetical protein
MLRAHEHSRKLEIQQQEFTPNSPIEIKFILEQMCPRRNLPLGRDLRRLIANWRSRVQSRDRVPLLAHSRPNGTNSSFSFAASRVEGP